MAKSYISSGVVSSGLIVGSGTSLYVLNGGEADDTTVNYGAEFLISSGGYASGALVKPGGYIGVASDGVISGIKENGGVVKWDSGASVFFLPNMFTGSKYGYNGNAYSATIHSGTTAVSTTVLSAGKVYVYDGGLTLDTLVKSAGDLFVYSGAQANNTVIESGGAVSVGKEGSASNVVVSQGAYLYVAYDGVTNDIKENGGVVEWAAGAEVSFVPSVISGYKYGYGCSAYSATLHSGTTATNTQLLSAGRVYVYDGAEIYDTVVKSAGDLFLYAGASASGAVIDRGGAVSVCKEGTLSSVVVSQGAYLYTAYDGVTHAIKEEGGIVEWADGAEVTFVPSVFSGYKYGYGCNAYSATLHSGTTATNTQLNSAGRVYVYNGAQVSTTRVNSAGDLFVYSGGRAVDNDLKLSGAMSVFKGGYASDIVVSSGGYLVISSGGTALSIVENGGLVEWYDGATVTILPNVFSKFSYGSGANTYSCVIHSGTTAVSTTLNSGGKFYVRNNALAMVTRINSGGTMYVNPLGSSTQVTLKKGGTIVNSGTIVDANVSSGAGVYVSSGGSLTGQVTIETGAVISAYSGSYLNFNLIGATVGGSAFVNDLSLVKGTPTYSLTVNGQQESGKYSLAAGAASFAKTVSVIDAAGTALGTLTLGTTKKINGVDYTLNLDNDNVLSVSVSGSAPPVTTKAPRGDRDGNGVSDVMFVWTGNNCAHGYWMNGKSEWWSANAVSVSADWDNLGSYDMSGDGKADAVMFGNVEVSGIKGAYIGYYQNGDDVNGWVQIGYLNNAQNIAWSNKVGNLTGNSTGANSIVWYAPELYALGAWTDGTETWATISGDFGGDQWTLVGTGDFDGDGKDSIVMTYSGGLFYKVELDGTSAALGSMNWSGWDVRAIADFAGDGKDDIVLFHKETGVMALCADGNTGSFTTIGQLDPKDWFIAGAGDYNGDGRNDLLVRQYSTGMLGYYSGANQALWNEMGRGVDMDWTVIA